MGDLMPVERIERVIYLIRGQKVMLDSDLAELYGVKTFVLNQAVKRNKERFPEDFMFSLTREEILRISQFVISSANPKNTLKFSKNVNAFTEQGVAMLSGVLRSKRAIMVNIAIMRAFVRIRRVISINREIARKLTELEHKIERHDGRLEKHDGEIDAVFSAIRKLILPARKKTKKIGFLVDRD